VVEIVRVVLAGFAPGVTWLGLKEQDAKLGKLEQESDTVGSKEPNSGVTVTV
jgi:hypothetical protein